MSINCTVLYCTVLYCTNSECGEKAAHENWSIGLPEYPDSTRYSNYFEDYWPCAGGISAVNVIGIQLRVRDPINSGLA